MIVVDCDYVSGSLAQKWAQVAYLVCVLWGLGLIQRASMYVAAGHRTVSSCDQTMAKCLLKILSQLRTSTAVLRVVVYAG